MGRKTRNQLIYILGCLLAAAFLINFKTATPINISRIRLSEAFERVGAWSAVNDVEMEQHIVESLDLDDYLFRSYKKDGRVVSLYIGYYHTADKVGAAHSPLVCFPGQGWEISQPKVATVETAASHVNAEKILIHKGQQRELILYWFQAYDRTSPGTLKQKLNNFWAKIRSKPEDNAFVRVSVSIQGDHAQDALESADAFIQAFYPKFLAYVTNQQSS